MQLIHGSDCHWRLGHDCTCEKSDPRDATIARLTAERDQWRKMYYDTNETTAFAIERHAEAEARAEVAEALLGAAYRAALEDAAVTCQIEADRGQRSGEMRYHLGASSCRSAISALTPPADLAALLVKEAGE